MKKGLRNLPLSILSSGTDEVGGLDISLELNWMSFVMGHLWVSHGGAG